jgi:hypothetical protein
MTADRRTAMIREVADIITEHCQCAMTCSGHAVEATAAVDLIRAEIERLSEANAQVWADNERLRAALGKPLDTPEGHKLKHDAGLPHLPTQLTYECRLAVGREGPRGYDWEDKPHRVVYDLCRELEARAALAEEKQ